MTDRVASLDLLRGLAACAVAIPHFFFYRSGGVIPERISVVAVEIFFVLSGFVLAPQILLILGGKVKRSVATFLVRRWMRTIPAFLLALVLISIVHGRLGSADFWRYAGYVQNLFGQHNESDYFPIAWSLSVEEWFYIAFPVFMLLGLAAPRVEAHWRYAALALFFIVLITIGRTLFGDRGAWGSDVRRVTAFRVDSIAYGFLLYLWMPWLSNRTRSQLAAGFIVSLALLFALLALVETSVVAQFFYPPAAAAFGSLAILVFLRLEHRLRGHRLRAICDLSGKLSYSIYLFHLICLYAVAASLDRAPLVIQFAAYGLSVAILAAMSSFWLEQPILQRRPRYTMDGGVPRGA